VVPPLFRPRSIAQSKPTATPLANQPSECKLNFQLFFQIVRNRRELFQSRFQISRDVRRNHFRRRQIGRFLKCLILQAKMSRFVAP
jgi:hypothetical protein